jgi:IS30 family transposase
MPKGKPWSNDEEKQLRTLLDEHRSVEVIAKALGKTVDSVNHKIRRLGIKEEGASVCVAPSSSDLVLPKELPSVEEALKILCAALKALQQGGLDQAEIFRLRTIIQGCKIYKELLADYINYRGIEAKLIEMEEKYEHFASQAKGDTSKQDNAPVVQTPT